MDNSTPPCCCRNQTPADHDSRRGFLEKATAIACGAVALATPVAAGVVTFLNPLRQKSQGGQFMRLASLDTIPEDGTPLKVPVIADRTDAWSRFPAEPIGAVFLRRSGGSVEALQVICPHAGCSINYDAAVTNSSVPATRPVSTWQANGPTRPRPAPAIWTRWKSRSATRTRSG